VHGLISVLDRGQFVVWQTPNWERGFCGVIAKFHYTDPRGPERTGTDFVGDPHGPTEFLGDPRRARIPLDGPDRTKSTDFVWSGPVGPV